MKQGWEIKTIGSICDIKTGKLDANAASENGAYPFFTCSQTPLRIDNYAYDCECVLVAGNGELNAKYYKGKFNAYQRTYIITTKSEYKDISVKYLYKFFSKYIEQLRQLSIGGVIKYIKLGNLTDAKLPVPSREEQERIVEELNCLSGIIERKREQLRELDALAQSIFYQMFGDPITNEKGWEVKKVKDIFSVKIGPFGSLLHNSDYISGGTPLVNPIHMHNERICPDYDFSVSDNKLKELGNYILHTDDIVLARRGDIGRCAIVGMNEDGYLCGTGSLFIRPITNINSNFIIKQIRCNTMIEHLTSLAKGATMLNINCKIVEELIVILPPLTLQQEFAEKIEAIEKQKELIKKSISEVEDLFNSRMNYYFN